MKHLVLMETARGDGTTALHRDKRICRKYLSFKWQGGCSWAQSERNPTSPRCQLCTENTLGDKTGAVMTEVVSTFLKTDGIFFLGGA